MKRHSLLLLFACIASLVSADPIGPSQAIKIASAYMQAKPSAMRAQPVRRANTRSVSEADTLAPLYIVSRGENAGFVIVSGDNCLPEIIGYTEQGDFVEADMPPALLDMLQGYARLVEEAQAAGAPARTPVKAPADRVSVKPLIEAHWHQTAPYNDLAPFLTGTTNRAVTGCTCTAAVMVLHYFRRDLPNELLSTTPTYSYGDAPVTVSYPKGTPIQWDLMLNSYPSNYPAEMGNAVAVLNAAFGAGIWQTYGSSTSGQIMNIVDGYNSYFNMSSACEYQNNISQSTWETRIYNNLINKQPMVYAGVHESQGGHAIILDGYNAPNNLFHFNFGWGGQGDGYYTLDAQTGINGFAGQQGMVYNIAPKKPNITAKLHVDKQAVKRTETTIRVTATNNGTLDYSGFNIYWSTSERKPSSSTTVSASNKEMKLSTGESGEFTCTFKPTLEKKYYIYLTDKRYNVLDKAEVEILPTNAQFTLESFEISASNKTEEHASGTYRLLYHDKLTAKAVVSSSSNGTIAQPGIRLRLMTYNEETESFEYVRNITIDDYIFSPGERKEVETTVSRISTNERYALIATDKLTNIDDDAVLQFTTADTVMLFKVCDPTLDSIYTKEGSMALKGEWDPMRFAELASDTAITSYDLTQVEGLNSQPIAANPNALYYTNIPLKGYNIVYQNNIDELRLQSGYNFAPLGNHTATAAIFTPKWEVGPWTSLALPFTALVPDGYICRRPIQVSSSSLRKAVITDTIHAGTPYIMMISKENPTPITASNITIDMSATSIGLPEFQAVLSSSIADGQTLVLDTDPATDIQYFNRVDSGTVLKAFTGVMKYDTRRMRASVNSTSDQAYRTLAQAIQTAVQAHEKWQSRVVPEWNTLLLDSIAETNKIFSDMEISSGTTVKNIATALLDYTEIYKLQLIDKSEPIDYTGYIINPSFETGKKGGWTTQASATVRTNSTLSTYAAGIDGQYFLYNESASGSTGISQAITDLPRGYYRLTASVGTSEGNEVCLFAGDSTTHVAAHEWGRFYLSEGVIDSIWVEDGNLTIGIEGGTHWYKADNFHLYYLGAGDDTAISLPEADKQDAFISRKGIYDLFGRRINEQSDMLPGRIYIVDGRKVIAK